MTIQVSTVNLLLETRGGARHEGAAAWYVLIVFTSFVLTLGYCLFVCINWNIIGSLITCLTLDLYFFPIFGFSLLV